jgi:acyl phosphate:glycerol-3-phosphate acyltransferase
MTQPILFALLGYACGSIPFGLLLTQAAGLGDVRKIGSGNIGATNVLRTGSKKIAALTLLCDALKGYFPVLAASLYGGENAVLAAAAGAMAGHIFPVWLGFKGGKGVATNIGVLFGFSWMLGVAFLAAWLVLAVLFRISSLAALVATALSPFIAMALGLSTYFIPLIILAAVVWIKHAQNISRLIHGTESKINLGS